MGPSNADIDAARQNAITVEQYFDSMSKLYRWKFLERSEAYQLNMEAIERLKELSGEYFVLAFSAQWCEECSKCIPVLGLVSDTTGLEVGVLGKIKTDPLSRTSRWRVPPSPPEVLTFGVEKLPWIVLYDGQGKEAGKIIEGPEHTDSIEEELLFLVGER